MVADYISDGGMLRLSRRCASEQIQYPQSTYGPEESNLFVRFH